MRALLITVSLFAGVLVILNFDDLFLSDAGRKICQEEYDSPHWFLFNGDYRKCTIDKRHQIDLVRSVQKNLEEKRYESLNKLNTIQKESLEKVKKIGKKRFVVLERDLPLSLPFKEDDPIITGDIPSRYLKKRFAGCNFQSFGSSDLVSNSAGFVCYRDEKQSSFVSLNGNIWKSSDHVKYLNHSEEDVDLYIEVMSIPTNPGFVRLRYEVHGFEISESMIVNYFDHQLAQLQEDYSVLLQ
jgi:hypothetical protein